MTDLLQPALGDLCQGAPTTESSFIPLDMTYVVYSRHSHLSLFFALITFLPLVIFISLATLVLFRRELEALNQCIGLVLSTALNHALKRAFAHPRPAHSAKEGHGMPSDHAQFMAFYTAYASCWLFHRACVRGYTRYVLVLGLMGATALVAVSRLDLGVHSVDQVGVGLGVGLVTGYGYHVVSRLCLWPLYDWVLGWWVMRWLCMKDMSVVPDVMQFEWESWRAYKEWIEEKEREKAGKSTGEGEVDVRADGQGTAEAAASSLLRRVHTNGAKKAR